VHKGDLEGRYVFLNVDSFGNTELYKSPSISRDKVKEFDQIRIKTMKGSSSSSRREVEQLRINKRGDIDKLHNSINAKRKGKY
jgi:hypothetical protein